MLCEKNQSIIKKWDHHSLNIFNELIDPLGGSNDFNPLGGGDGKMPSFIGLLGGGVLLILAFEPISGVQRRPQVWYF
jgi:hypothetical protein